MSAFSLLKNKVFTYYIGIFEVNLFLLNFKTKETFKYFFHKAWFNLGNKIFKYSYVLDLSIIIVLFFSTLRQRW